MKSGGTQSATPITHRVQSLSSADTRGKHRIHAELKRLEQETRFLEVPTSSKSWWYIGFFFFFFIGGGDFLFVCLFVFSVCRFFYWPFALLFDGCTFCSSMRQQLIDGKIIKSGPKGFNFSLLVCRYYQRQMPSVKLITLPAN